MKTPPKPTRGRRGKPRDNDLAARVLAECRFTKDPIQVIQRHGIAQSTYYNWLEALQTDPTLGTLYLQRLNDLINKPWADELAQGIKVAIAKLVSLVEGLENSSPENIRTALEVVEHLADLELTRYGIASKQTSSSTDTAATEPSAAIHANLN